MKKHQKQNNRTIAFTQQVLLDMLLIVGELYETGMKTYRGPFSRPREKVGDRFAKKQCQGINELKKRGRIRIIKNGEKQFFELTQKGYQEALKSRIITKSKMMPDGDFCLVVFDVPEDIRKVRWAFRRLLKKADFYQVQKSVWESDREVVEELRELVKQLKAEQYIRVYRANGER
ncbi:CRISPR-associated endonuclease Cas2 [Patescibacteria group bacterium]|nr:CRISPR-associated endonuclease Cas2 [Patescibacteria group bacterium]